ncbi:MAG: hypothetical protein ACRDA3_03250 [Peptostreptococcaceae bacterium]
MIRICSNCSGMSIDDLKEMLLGREIEDECIGECGSEFVGYVGDELVTASSQEEFIEKVKQMS